mgnify:FL=1
MEVNLELYKIFYIVAEKENITKASEELHISQPAITKQIKNLEDSLGFDLFIRTKRGVILTEEGKAIYEQVNEIVKHLKNIDNITHSIMNHESGTLRIGTGKSMAKIFLIPVLETLHKKYPNIRFELTNAPTSVLIEKLKSGKIDVIFSKLPHKIEPGIKYMKIGELENIFICNKDYDNLINREVKFNELLNYPIILPTDSSITRSIVKEYFNNQFFDIKHTMEAASLSLVTSFSKIGLGIGVTTKEFIKKELDNNTLFEIDANPKLPNIDYGLIMLETTVPSPIAREFCNLINKKQ